MTIKIKYTISIIIATYNAEKTIKRCLESIIIQDLSHVELVIIDGKSKDSTLEILNSYGEKIDIIISEKDNGIYDAWNKGINASHGQWIMFIGADDTLNKDSINTYLEFIQLNKNCKTIDYICSQVQYVDENEAPIKIIGTAFDWKKYKHIMTVAHVGSLHNRHLFENVGLYNCSYKICADYELLMRKQDNLKTLFIPEVTAQMSIGGMSCSFKALREACKIKIKVAKVNLIIAYLECFIQTLLLVRLLRRTNHT